MRWAAILCLGLAAGAQWTPGNFLVVDENGSLWEVTPAGTVTSLLKLPRTGVWSAEFDAGGRLLVGGTGILWRIAPGGRVTTLFDGLHIYPIGDLAVTARGTIWLGAMGNAFLYEVDGRGQLVSVVRLPPVSGTWGLGLQGQTLFVADQDAQRSYVHRVDLATGRVSTLLVGGPLSFFQAGAVTPAGAFVFGEETVPALLQVDPAGKLTTLLQGPPLVDPAEGITLDGAGNLVFTDDGALAGRAMNRIFRLQGSRLTTLASGSPFFDVNGIALIPGLTLTNLNPLLRPGSVGTIQAQALGASKAPYAFATALSARAGFAVPGGRRFPLDPDPLFLLTAQNLLATIFRRFRGNLDTAGRAALSIAVPPDRRLVGLVLHTAGVTLHPAAPGAIQFISPVTQTRIVP